MSGTATAAATKPGVLVLGASSSIARAVAGEYARRGHALYLAGRDAAEMERTAADLRLRHGVPVHAGEFDALDTASHAAFFRDVVDALNGHVSGVVLAFGLLGEHARAVADYDHAADIIAVNYTGAVSVLTHATAHMAAAGGGFVLGLSSVAGDRGRQSNYIYGSAKGAFSLYLQGLRNRFAPEGIHVVTAKLGFVDTRMTFGLPGMFLVASPAQVGAALVRAVERRRDVVYVPAFWRLIMLIIRAIPERVFKRLKL